MPDFKYKLEATVPVTQYGNLRPTFSGDDLSVVEQELQEFWNKYNSSPLKVGSTTTTPVKSTIYTCVASGVEVKMDGDHNYDKGWMGGSTFKKQFIPDFDGEAIAGRMAENRESVDPKDILKAWNDKGEVASGFGTAVHLALENYARHKAVSDKLEKDYYLTDNPILQPIVKAFYEGREDEEAMVEPFVAHEGKKVCGFIDRMLIVDKKSKTVRVQDYKTDSDINKRVSIGGAFKGVVDNTKLGAYWIQLSMYAWVLEQHGYSVEGLDIFHLTVKDGKPVWDTYTHEVLELEMAFKEIGR